jgi:hypothetical protein
MLWTFSIVVGLFIQQSFGDWLYPSPDVKGGGGGVGPSPLGPVRDSLGTLQFDTLDV